MVFESIDKKKPPKETPGEEMSTTNREEGRKPSAMLDDSLDWNHSPGARVAPKSGLSDETTDYLAFAHNSQDDLYLGLFPKYIVNLLQDTTNWKNRVSGVTKIQSVVNGISNKSLLEKNLPLVLELLSRPMSDSHFKVSQMGLELIECLVKKVGRGIRPHMPELVKSIMPKVGSNKIVLKEAGMRVLMELMRAGDPQPVVMEVANFGLCHKTSRIREESVNVITAALLTFERSQFDFHIIVRELCPCMTDGKVKVRQATFEAMTLLCHLEGANLKEVVSNMATLHRTSSSEKSSRQQIVENGLEDKELTLMDAFYTRISRKLLPTLTEAGLVQHGLQVVNDKLPATTGSDVAWILSAGDGKSKGKLSGSGGLDASCNQSGESMFRPYRSAGKRLPWEKDQKAQAAAAAANTHVNGHVIPMSKVSGNLQSYPSHPPFSTSSPQHLSSTLPLNTPSTTTQGVGKRSSYADMHLAKVHYSQTKTSAGAGAPGNSSGPSPKRTGSASVRKGTLEALAASMTSRLPNSEGDSPLFTQRRPFPPPTGKRHNSLPDSIRPADAYGGNGGGYYGPMAGEERHLMHGSYMHHGKGPVPVMQPVPGPASMSVTWPRGYGGSMLGGGGGGGAPPPHAPTMMSMMNSNPVSLRASQQQQISADVSKAVGAVQNSVRTNVSRPLSKPRVRNPLTSKMKEHSANLASVPKHTDSPTLLEREFLTSTNNSSSGPSAGWGETSWDEEYFKMIPEDTTILNSSLSSSLSSLCAARDLESAKTAGELDKLKHIRKEAASRKAQLLSAATSAATSASNSPEFSRHSQEPSNKSKDTVSAPVTKAKKPKAAAVDPLSTSTVSKPLVNKKQAFGSERHSISPPMQAYDPDRTFTVDSDKTYSMAFAKRQAKAAAAVAVQTKRDKTPPQSVDTDPRMSLEGRSLDRDRGDPALSSREGQAKKKPRKAEALKGNLPPPKLRSGPLGYEPGIERRPSIERGGTNTIEMEVSGIGSRGSSRGKENLAIVQDLPSSSQSLSQPHAATATTTKENSGGRKRRKHSPVVTGVEETDTAVAGVVQQSVGQYASSTTKPPVPPTSMVQERSTNPSLSAPIKNAQKKVKKNRQHSHHQASSQESGYGTAGDETPSRKTSYGTTVSDTYSSASSGGGGGGNGSPGESQLIELQPFINPEQGLRESVAKIASEDWSAKCDGMIGMRQLAMYHPGVLQPQLHSVVLAVQKEVKNLRSSVARGAIACLGDMFATMQKAMEQDLDSSVRILLHKGGESNAFIRDDVDKALTEMIYNVSPGRSLTALISGGLQHSNSKVRKTTSKFICASVENYGPSKLMHAHKDLLERTLVAVVQLTKDSVPEARYYARCCLNQLWPLPEFDPAVNRLLSDQMRRRAKEAVDNLKAKGVGELPSESHSAKGGNGHGSRHSTGGPIRVPNQSRNTHRQMEHHDGSPGGGGGSSGHPSTTSVSPKNSSSKSRKQHSYTSQESAGSVVPPMAHEVQLPEGLLERLKASSWSERHEAISELEAFVSAHPAAMTPHLHKVFDVFSPRLTDRNSKVNLHALQAFSNMVPLLCNTLIPVTNNIIVALVPNLASRNATIHSAAMTVLDLLSQCVDPVHLIQSVANNGQYGNARVQPIMIKKLAELTTSAYDQKPQLVYRQVLPVMWHLLTSRVPATGETKVAAMALCGALWQCMGQALVDSGSHLSPEQKKSLRDMIDRSIQ